MKDSKQAEQVGEFVAIDSLIPHPKNPRNNDDAVKEIKQSIKRFGFTSPIIARKADRMIIAGHTRYKAAKELNLDTVPVVFVDLNPTDAELLMIADNKLGEKATWNTDLLSDLLQDLHDQGEQLDVLGFDGAELADLLYDLSDSEDNSSNGDQEDHLSIEPVKSDLHFTLLKGNCLDKLKELPDNSIDSIVTDPPYELGFMGKSWDSTGIAYSVELWQECLRVLKHGGHLVAFSGSRTVFPMGVAIAEAGFEVRDMISWIYTSGFPKSLDIYKQTEKAEHKGWGTALKPAQEPAVLARKPIDPDCSSIAENVLKWGTGAINIDAGRFAYGDDCWIDQTAPNFEAKQRQQADSLNTVGHGFGVSGLVGKEIDTYKENGRFPANVYQCSKPARSEKEAGLDHLKSITGAEATHRKEGSAGLDNPRAGAGRTAEEVKNFHPTVKPIKLMRWLCRLLTPQGGTVLDPFLGSGTTAVSAILEGFNAIGCEMTEDYYPIIEGRINWAKSERLKESEGAENGEENKIN